MRILPSRTDMPHPSHIRRQLTDPRRWLQRVLLMIFAAATGCAVVALNQLGEYALACFYRASALAWWVPFVWMPAITLFCLWLTRRFAPGAAGSGIPQVMSALNPKLDDAQRARFVSVRLSVAKLLLTSLGLLAGLSLGREGPSVQVAAGVLYGARRFLGTLGTADRRGLLVAGGAAGVAAAFNAPLAGVMFAIEELSRAPEHRSSGLVIAAIVFSGFLAISLQGNHSYFGVIHAHEIDLSLLLPALLVTLACGLAGGIFSRLVVLAADHAGRSRALRLRARHPYLFTLGCSLVIALIGCLSQGATYGSGYALTKSLLAGSSEGSSITFLKYVATWLTTLCMVPGGLFAPALTIGASLGNDMGHGLGVASVVPLIAIGMTGFLTATTQAPMTAFVIVMEMVEGHDMVFTLMICALTANLLSRMLSPPLYAALSRSQLRALRSHEP